MTASSDRLGGEDTMSKPKFLGVEQNGQPGPCFLFVVVMAFRRWFLYACIITVMAIGEGEMHGSILDITLLILITYNSIMVMWQLHVSSLLNES